MGGVEEVGTGIGVYNGKKRLFIFFFKKDKKLFKKHNKKDKKGYSVLASF